MSCRKITLAWVLCLIAASAAHAQIPILSAATETVRPQQAETLQQTSRQELSFAVDFGGRCDRLPLTGKLQCTLSGSADEQARSDAAVFDIACSLLSSRSGSLSGSCLARHWTGEQSFYALSLHEDGGRLSGDWRLLWGTGRFQRLPAVGRVSGDAVQASPGTGYSGRLEWTGSSPANLLPHPIR